MCALPDPSVVTDFEHGWADVVDAAVTTPVVDVAVLDLGLGAREKLHAAGYAVRCALTLRDALPLLEHDGLLPPTMRAAVEQWLVNGEY